MHSIRIRAKKVTQYRNEDVKIKDCVDRSSKKLYQINCMLIEFIQAIDRINASLEMSARPLRICIIARSEFRKIQLQMQIGFN